MTPEIMELFVGRQRDTIIRVRPVDMGCGAGQIDCIECEGTGDWDRYMPEPTGEPDPCVVCKGTGRILISI